MGQRRQLWAASKLMAVGRFVKFLTLPNAFDQK
jgi:hypothetical protein